MNKVCACKNQDLNFEDSDIKNACNLRAGKHREEGITTHCPASMTETANSGSGRESSSKSKVERHFKAGSMVRAICNTMVFLQTCFSTFYLTSPLLVYLIYISLYIGYVCSIFVCFAKEERDHKVGLVRECGGSIQEELREREKMIKAYCMKIFK